MSKLILDTPKHLLTLHHPAARQFCESTYPVTDTYTNYQKNPNTKKKLTFFNKT
jgi:hypothetical protein